MLSAQDAAKGFDAVGAPARIVVLLALVRAGPDGLLIGELQKRLEIPASTLAHHIRILLNAGLISQERQGRTTTCRPNLDAIEELAAFLMKECCADRAPQPAGQSTGRDGKDDARA
ncbi:ArsR/SmtB family transcription factor [Nitratireductor alexandrii]|uniref:ArsR/SmtB family transcription factor n=1 Tax=Nitratireductor alexandrii TaxID=2448161 RepID=UPI000FDAD091|nr:helix-turn-helix transcriptional regulator [Nitratireductor alexandrii]